MYRTQQKSNWLKTETTEYESKCLILEKYEQQYGIYVSQKKRDIMFSQLDVTGVKLIMTKKLAMLK